MDFQSTDAKDILADGYVNSEELQDRTMEQIKEEYIFDEIKNAFDERIFLPRPAWIFFGDDNENFVRASNILSQHEDNNEFVSFLCSDIGQNIKTSNSLAIHVEAGDIFYNDFNTKENFYNFLFVQQDEYKQFIPKIISYHYSFEKYTRNYLPSFLLEEIEKLDLLSYKNAKYLL